MSIRYKILIILLLLAFATHSIVTSVYYFSSQEIVKDLAKYHLVSMANVQHQRMKGLIKANWDKLNLISSRTQMRASFQQFIDHGDTNSLALVKRILDDAVNQSETITDIFILSQQGTTMVSSAGSKDGQSFQDHVLFQRGRDHQTTSMLLADAEYQAPTFIFSAPLKLNGETLGVVAMQVNMDRLNDFMRDYSGLGKTGEVFMATQTPNNNILVFTPLRFEDFPQLFSAGAGMSQLMVSDFRGGEDVLQSVDDYRGKPVFAISRLIPEFDIVIIVKMDEDEVLSINEDLKHLIIYLIFFLLIVVLVASLILAHKITRPVINLTEVAVMISEGHLEKRIRQFTDDELGRLAQALNTMADRLIQSNLVLEEKVEAKTMELRSVNAKLEQMAQTDALTGLKNRGYFDAHIDIEWRRNMRNESYLSILLIDIDYFKRVNDNMGHATGDKYLKAVAGALKQTIRRAEDMVARLGGEEFVVVLGNSAEADAVSMASRIQQQIAQLELPNQYSDVSHFVTASIGICSVIPSQQSSVADALEHADQALYQAKALGRNRILVYDSSSAPATGSS
ncbi:diguanylate cyclase [Neiella sp. HB171785]|uniref:diguanylate cyclase n=1 Tax=Neiella litorisoli TaxID=2771431 RepID=A0A8J6QPX8_9GAMM|nr:diguanylate cyclase [Neiella litorisoli]MBD1388956.1 diguanylate cyclase [Neiella litorisoli]